jgi:hypothetical protein
MANTRETLGDQATLDALVSGTLTDFEENAAATIKAYTLGELPNLTAARLPGATRIEKDAFANDSALETLELWANFYKQSTTDYLGENTLSGLKNLILHYNGSDQPTAHPVAFRAMTKILHRNGAIFVPQSKLSEHKAGYSYDPTQFSFLPIETRYPVSNDDYSTITDTWAEIVAAEEDGTYVSKYAIGDSKKITLTVNNNPVTRYAVIVGIDADDKADGTGKAHLSWLLSQTVESRAMNSNNTAVGGWGASTLRTYLRDTVLPALDIKDYVVPVTKSWLTHDGTTKSETSSSEMIWIPSFYELAGPWGNFAETTGANYYTDKKININARYGVMLTRTAYTKTAYVTYASSDTSGWGSVAANTSKAYTFGFCT